MAVAVKRKQTEDQTVERRELKARKERHCDRRVSFAPEPQVVYYAPQEPIGFPEDRFQEILRRAVDQVLRHPPSNGRSRAWKWRGKVEVAHNQLLDTASPLGKEALKLVRVWDMAGLRRLVAETACKT